MGFNGRFGSRLAVAGVARGSAGKRAGDDPVLLVRVRVRVSVRVRVRVRARARARGMVLGLGCSPGSRRGT